MRPASIGFEQGVRGDDELSHDGGDGDLGGLPGSNELLIFCLEIGIVPGGDEGRHIESLPHVGASATDEALAFPLSGLSSDGGETGEGCGLLVLEAAEFGHGGDELVGGQRSDAGDAGEDLMPAGERGIGGDQVGDLGIERLDMPIDLLEPLPALALEEGDGEVLLAILERGAIAHEAVSGIDELRYLRLLCASSGSDRRLQGGRHTGQQHGIDAIGLGQSASRLGEAPGALRVELHAGPVGQSRLQRPMVGCGCLIGDPLDRPLSQPGDQRLVALGGVGELALGAGRVDMAVEARFGDVDADRLW